MIKTGTVIKRTVPKCVAEQKVGGRVIWDATEHGNYLEKEEGVAESYHSPLLAAPFTGERTARVILRDQS